MLEGLQGLGFEVSGSKFVGIRALTETSSRLEFGRIWDIAFSGFRA